MQSPHLLRFLTAPPVNRLAFHVNKHFGVANMNPLEGLLAINKPTGISSAEALRQLQRIFKPSTIFAATLEAEKERRDRESSNQRRRRKKISAKQVEVKIGHGGTLDPMASGVLIAGIGAGTKQLQAFLGCTKTYEATALFGAGTDTYDALGKVIAWAGWEGITRENVGTVLEHFRGDIMQKPPIYSALHMDGKRLYEYAREGKALPAEIKARPVSTVSLELTGFTFEHDYELPKEEAPAVERAALNALEGKAGEGETAASAAGEKRRRSASPDATTAKKQKSTPEPETTAATTTEAVPKATDDAATTSTKPEGKPPITTLRMTVTSGFYVRSLIHDLGKALGSEAHMVKLVRTRQSDFEIGAENVLEWDELMEKPEEVWGPKVEGILKKWAEDRWKK